MRPVNVVGEFAYVSGHGPADGARRLARGKVGVELTVEEGRAVAGQCALAVLASLRLELGDLSRVRQWLTVRGYVNCAPGFEETPAVLNGASDLLVELWGEAGQHARSAIGVAALPFAVPVEIEAVVLVS